MLEAPLPGMFTCSALSLGLQPGHSSDPGLAHHICVAKETVGLGPLSNHHFPCVVVSELHPVNSEVLQGPTDT